jgi:protein SCO1/2
MKSWPSNACTLVRRRPFAAASLVRFLVASVLLVSSPCLPAGSDPAAPSDPKLALPDQSTLRLQAQHYFTDLQLVNQDGKRLRFYSDLIDGKVVVINSFFAGCTGVCKVTMPLFQRLQEKFADRAGDGLHLISISVDPEADTPASLKKYATALGAKPGWDFLSGDKETVQLALQKLGLATEVKEGHSNVFLVGNGKTGLWKKLLGVAPPEEISSAVESVLEDGP